MLSDCSTSQRFPVKMTKFLAFSTWKWAGNGPWVLQKMEELANMGQGMQTSNRADLERAQLSRS